MDGPGATSWLLAEAGGSLWSTVDGGRSWKEHGVPAQRRRRRPPAAAGCTTRNPTAQQAAPGPTTAMIRQPP